MDIFIENGKIREEYGRWCRHFGKEDPYDGAHTMGILDVLKAHFLIADYFYGHDYGIGGVGPKEPDLLHSAVYRQFVSFDGKNKWSDDFQKLATLIFGIVKDHPFHDANKRTALLVMLYALNKMKRMPSVSQRGLEDFVVAIAENSLLRHRRMQDLRRVSDDPEVEFIADYIKRNSRQIDKKQYLVTYRELDGILRRFGFSLANPSKNYIDVVRMEREKGLLGFGREREVIHKVAQIGFPGWKSQVGQGTISEVRKKTKLVPDNGVDSISFFKGADPMYAIIDEYAEPLRRLADR